MITLDSIATSTQSETIPLKAIIDSALCVGAGGSSGSLADKPILKNADGRLVIPASQVKGRLRHECEKLARSLHWPVCKSPTAQYMCPQRANISEPEAFNIPPYQLKERIGQTHLERDEGYTPQAHCLICQIFGNPALPARLRVSDLVCTATEDEIPEVLRPGVSINRRRRTAEEQKLYFLETSPANLGLLFEGSLQLLPSWRLADGSVPAPFAKALILTGLKHIHALGGSKSAGLGWLHWQGLEQHTDVPEEAWQWLGSAPKTLKKKIAGGEA